MKEDRQSPKLKANQITGLALAEEFGLTVRRIAQLADEGFFPPPNRGIYNESLAIRGIAKYYQKQYQRKGETQDAIDLEKLKAVRRENEKEAGILVEKSKVADELQKGMTAIRETLTRKLEHEMPTAMSGMGMAENRIVGRRMCDEVCDQFAAIFGRFNI